MKFSANLGFLWAELRLPDAIHAAKRAGFDAVECHWPYATPAGEVAQALAETGLTMLSLNTARGDVAAGEFGLAALPGREDEARTAIDEAIAYAREIRAGKVHVMAGLAKGKAARESFLSNLRYACAEAAPHDIGILIEPLNPHDAPGYYLNKTDQAIDIINIVNARNLSLMFDCYHVQRMEGDLANRLKTLMPHIGHIQFAGVSARGTPDHGEVDYSEIFALLASLGYTKPLGAEYKPDGPTEETLGWLERARAQFDRPY